MDRVDSNAADHIRTRSARYADTVDINPDWTVRSSMTPTDLLIEPDPRSAHPNSVRIVGYSPTARMVITVVALHDARGVLRGTSVWKTGGAPLRQYLEDRPDD